MLSVDLADPCSPFTASTEYGPLGRTAPTRIIIGTVVNRDIYQGHKGGITAREVARLMNQWGIPITENHARVRLSELAKMGRIERVSSGRFTGV